MQIGARIALDDRARTLRGRKRIQEIRSLTLFRGEKVQRAKVVQIIIFLFTDRLLQIANKIKQ